VRLFAIWLAIYWARWIPYLYTQAHEAEGMMETAVAVIVTVLGIAFVLALWFFPRTVARTLLPSESNPPALKSHPGSWFAVGCTLLGLWVLTSAVPALVRNAYVLLYVQRNNMPVPEGWGSGVLYYSVELGVGVWLLLGAAGVRKVLWWARSARIE
jgi:hypothetical protein